MTRSGLASLFLTLVCAFPVTAKAAEWPVKGKLIGKTKDGEEKKAKDVSGIACIEPSGLPRRCLLIDDETQFAQIVIVKDGELKAGDKIPLISDMFKDKPLEFDGEGVAYANGAFYVIGSHGHPRDPDKKLDAVKDKDQIEASIKAVSAVIRIPLTAGDVSDDGKLSKQVKAEPSRGLRDALKAAPEILPFVDVRLEKNGLTVGGVAVGDGTLYAGLRGPVLGVGQKAAIVAVPLGSLSTEASPAKPSVLKVDLGAGRGVRDLVASEDGFVILAGPSTDPKKSEAVKTGDYTLFRWDGAVALDKIVDLDGRQNEDGEWIKPEAVLPLGSDMYLILSDGAKEGAPRVVSKSGG